MDLCGYVARIQRDFGDGPEVDYLLLAHLQLPFKAAFVAGKALLKYRRPGGPRSSPMPDFYIGAHAELEELTLLTRTLSAIARISRQSS